MVLVVFSVVGASMFTNELTKARVEVWQFSCGGDVVGVGVAGYRTHGFVKDAAYHRELSISEFPDVGCVVFRF